MAAIDRGAAGDGEVGLEALQFANRLAGVPGGEKVEDTGAHRLGLEDAAVEQHRGGHQGGGPGAWPNQGGELFAGFDVLQAAAEEARDVLADHRIGRIGQAEFLQTAATVLVRQIVDVRASEEAVEHDLFQYLAAERG